MGRKIQKSNDVTLTHYIDNHPFTMMAILEEDDNCNYKVSYANKLLKQYFLNESNTSGEKFFKDFWTVIQNEMRYVHEEGIHKNQIEWCKNNQTTLLEVSIQSKTINEKQKHFIVELKEQKDLLAERQAREKLSYRYTSVIDQNMDSIISINHNLVILNSNPSFHEVFGYQKNEILGKSLLNLIDVSQYEKIKKLLASGFTGSSIEAEGIMFGHKEGNYFPTRIKVLPVIIEGVVNEIHLIVRDLSTHHKNNEKLFFLSYHDQLTGLWNRKALIDSFDETCRKAGEQQQKVAFIHLGLDRFKLINDSLGHEGADEILKLVGERLRNHCPKEVYRYSGDEFIIVLKNTVTSKAEKFAEKLLNEFGKPFYYNHQEYFISVSIGISMCPKDGKTLEELIRKSEQALSFVKEQGRSHYRFYKTEMDSLFPDEIIMESHLRRAIELDELKVYYQPQVDLKTGKISSFEALLRWNNRRFGFVPPGQFIPLAEASGLIHDIGDWVLDTVCKQLKEWQDKQYDNVRIAVNISPKQFQTNSLARKVREKIKKYGVEPSSLEVEITESALASRENTLETLFELKEIGVFVSVDDFGTGYSSLSYLKQYPIDTIKIDRSFIKDIESDEKNKAIAFMIINLAHNLGMDVIAEGVEKDLQASILLEAKCHKAQGYLYSRAVPISEIIDKYF